MDKDLAITGWILVALVLALLLSALVLTIRRMAIRRPGGAVACSLRRPGHTRWRRGVAAYRTDQLFWFRSLSLRRRPDAVIDRQALRLLERRLASADGIDRVLPPGTAVVRFDTGRPEETLWLAMSPGALTGLRAWVEAAPLPWLGEGVLDRP